MAVGRTAPSMRDPDPDLTPRGIPLADDGYGPRLGRWQPLVPMTPAYRSRSALVIVALVSLTLAALGLFVQKEEGAARPDPDNVIRLTVRTPRSGFNRLVVSVKICEPGSSRCATIDNVMVDTGSTGLRLEASAVPSWLNLPPFLGPDHRQMAECLHFVHDDAWGFLYRGDVHMGGLTAAGLPLQIIADGNAPQPASCPVSTVHPTSNGTLGLSPDLTDCRGACRQNFSRPGVYTCGNGTCVPIQGKVGPAYRLLNPVAALPKHNNGVVFDLPASPAEGAAEIAGTLTFGVETSDNNRLNASRFLRLDERDHFTTVYDGLGYPESYIDSGTETFVLADDLLPRCGGMGRAYCADPERQLEAVMVGNDGARLPMRFAVGDYRSSRQHRVGASGNVAVAADPASRAFVWGAPFFLGKRVSIVLDGMSIPGAPEVEGPLYAVPPRDDVQHSQ